MRWSHRCIDSKFWFKTKSALHCLLNLCEEIDDMVVDDFHGEAFIQKLKHQMSNTEWGKKRPLNIRKRYYAAIFIQSHPKCNKKEKKHQCVNYSSKEEASLALSDIVSLLYIERILF